MSPDSQGFSSNSLYRLGLRLGALVALIIIGYFVILFVSSGTITVTTGSNAANITVSSIPPLQRENADGGPATHYISAKAATHKTGTGTMTVRVHAGSYIVSVQNGSSQESKLIKIGWLSHNNVVIRPAGLTTTEPVLYESVQNVAADGSRLIYLNNDFNGVEYVNDQDQDVPVNANQYFTSVAWANPEYGVAQNNTGNLYVISGNDSEPLQSPISNLVSDSGAVYAIAPNRTIYIGFGSKVYRGTGDGSFTQIYSGFTSGDSLVAANNQVMIINPNVGGSTTSGGIATVITSNDKVISKSFGYPLGGWTPWSQNGKYVVISVDSVPEIFDSSLKQVGNVPQAPAVTNGAWLGDSTLFYASGGQLWSYDISRNDTKLIAIAPSGKDIQGISVNSDGSYVYATASNANDDYPRLLFRVGLKGQSVSSDLNTLQGVLPINSSTYTIGLRNFSGKPVIDITTYPGTDQNDALQSAQGVISGMINLNDVSFDVEAGD